MFSFSLSIKRAVGRRCGAQLPDQAEVEEDGLLRTPVAEDVAGCGSPWKNPSTYCSMIARMETVEAGCAQLIGLRDLASRGRTPW